MSDTKLEKVGKAIYHQPKEGRPIVWTKYRKDLWVKLTDVRVYLGLFIERPETSTLLAQEFREDGESAEKQEVTTPTGDELEEKYAESFGWRLAATGYLEDRSIGLIKKDGSVTSYSEHFDRIDVNLRSVSDTDKEKDIGAILYNDAEKALKWEKRTQPYLILELPVPESPLEKLCNEILSGRLSEVNIGAYVDVFQPEHEWALAEPWMRQVYYIEEEGYNLKEQEYLSRAYLSSITASRPIEQTRVSAKDNEDLASDGDQADEGAARDNDRGRSLNDLPLIQTEMLHLVNQRLGSIRTVGILMVIALFLMLLAR